MHLSFAYLGFVLTASAAAGSHHLARTDTIARLSVRSDEVPGQNGDLQMKCMGGCGGLPPPGPNAVWNAPIVAPGGLPPMNTFFSQVQSYSTITSNTVGLWGGGMDPQTILLQFQIMVTSLSTLFYSLQGGCPFQGNPQVFISTFAPMIIQIQSMITIISTQCVGIIGAFQSSFAVLTVLMQSIIGVAITMHVDIQQFFSACNFNPQLWSPLGFPVGNWMNGIPGGFPGGPGGFPGGPGGFDPNGLPGGPAGIDPNGLPGGSGGFGPGGVPGGPNGGGGVVGFFQPLSHLGQLLQQLLLVLEPIFKGLERLLAGVGLLLGHLGDALGGLLGGVGGGASPVGFI
ncbi:uncharacterized protein MELLADRAFT_13044 [Melampsora larici-populina 98AG31]|uniref:Secreted protein n=1 Tax=Melampsora larici-populina (strain 98AG31 / pathotype 3-4-7) TaxID=747676 RepID=F4RVV0_MELLP|nr:uncharacterized protein MELLADRAFT_13044 [Melampsora larici-populina 98AG31]EGG03422.1 secreted protein [Melampsora larici-populina 98AG31]